MMNTIAQLIAWLNGGMNALFDGLRGPIQAAPAWLSLTIVSVLLGVVMMVPFKYTSPQSAIGRTRDRIKANLLAMKLFKDSVPAVLKAQFRVFGAALMLPVLYLLPVLVMLLPFSLVLGQLGTWYQASPLEPGTEAVVVMQLQDAPLPQVSMEPNDAVRIVSGPVRVPSKHRVYWKLRAEQTGEHNLRFRVGDEHVEKSLSVGGGLMPVSMKRPALHIGDLILYPAEKPFIADSPVQSIEIQYPERSAPVTGSGNWVIALFVISMLAALAVKPVFKVKL